MNFLLLVHCVVVAIRMAVALIALPKFYTQVLHLMNKMNLPPPFEERSIPGIFSKDREEKAAATEAQRQGLFLKRKFPGAQRSSSARDEFTIEEDDDEEEEEEDGGEDRLRQTDQTESSQESKRQRVSDTSAAHTADPTETPLPLAHDLQSTPVVSVSKPSATTAISVHTSKAKRSAPTTGIARAFENIREGTDSNRSVRPGVISEAELNRQRLPLEGSVGLAVLLSFLIEFD